jgi:hypothetical protein
MHSTLRALARISIVLIVTVGSAPVPFASQTTDAGRGTYAQEQSPSGPKRIYIWTRARIAAANKRWAKNKEKFSGCAEQLQQEQKKRRLRPHGQADFMQDCMNRNP